MFLKNEQGVTSIEYALIALLIALGILSSLKLLGTDVTALYQNVAAAVIAAVGG
jgi:pilus assembly protein Flp/PilA